MNAIVLELPVAASPCPAWCTVVHTDTIDGPDPALWAHWSPDTDITLADSLAATDAKTLSVAIATDPDEEPHVSLAVDKIDVVSLTVGESVDLVEALLAQIRAIRHAESGAAR